MNPFFLVAVLAAAALPSRAEPLDDLRAGEAGLQENIRRVRADAALSAQAKPDIFRFDASSTPAYISAAVEKATAERAAKDKFALRAEIASYENSVEAASQERGQGCQARLETAVADHARFQTLAAADMHLIHSTQVQCRDALLAELVAGKGKPDSAWTKIEADYQVMSALRKRYHGGSVDEVVKAAEASGADQLRRDSSKIIELAKAAIAAEAKAQDLSTDNIYRAEDLKIALEFGAAEPTLTACAGPYRSQREIPLKGSRGEKNTAYYRSCVKAGLFSGKLEGDSLLSALGDNYTSAIVRQTRAEYATEQVSDCVSLEAARRAFAQKP
jgi:hypothetical protein